jgi:hypothetical protein
MEKINEISSRKAAIDPLSLCPCVDVAADHVEGGLYISPEFQIGQVYDGSNTAHDPCSDDVILYRPIYVNVVPHRAAVASTSRGIQKAS